LRKDKIFAEEERESWLIAVVTATMLENRWKDFFWHIGILVM